MSLLQNSNAIQVGGYNIANSLRFQSASSTYLARTPSVTANQTKWTWSAWVKRGSLGSIQSVFGASSSSASQTASYLRFTGSDTLEFLYINNGVVVVQVATTQVFRDTSSWYHLVLTYDSTEATASNRVKIYVNGVQVTAFGTATYPSLNGSTNINAVIAHTIGSIYAPTSFGQFFDGYQTEINFINDQALTPSSFGETHTLTGQWVAKKYTGTYGTNGFYLPFSNGTSTTTLGYDSSGNSNNWTLNNFTRSAGTTDCWVNDVPSGNGSSVGGTQPNSNYAVLNTLGKAPSISLTSANLSFTNSTFNTYPAIGSTIFVSTGKWYFEGVFTGGGTAEATIGLSTSNNFVSNSFQTATSGTTYWNNAQGISKNGSYLSATPTFTYNDIVGVAYDADAGTVTYYKNGVAQTPVVTGITGSYAPTFGIQYYTAGQWNANFGQRSFAYTPPSGFKALCTANLPASTIVKGNTVFDATLFTGTAATLNVTNAAGFSPDLVWIKQRNAANNHYWFDSVRGVFNYLFSDGTNAEASANNTLTAFNSNGFTLGTSNGSNPSGGSLVAWQWDAGSSTVTNTNGTISSSVRANATAGVSVVTYTSAASGTVGHGLGVAPKIVLAKRRNLTSDWYFNTSIIDGSNDYLLLNSTAAKVDNSGTALPTSTVFTQSSLAVGDTWVAYCFAEIAGFSKFGSYTGNGSVDGPFVFTGFRPKYVMIKRTDFGAPWIIFDSARNTFNVANSYLIANASDAEANGSSPNDVNDLLSNGFKIRCSNLGENASGGTYIYMAFAENPFANANAR